MVSPGTGRCNFLIRIFNHDLLVLLRYESLDVSFGKSKKSEYIYKFLFLIFVVLGASVSLGAVLDFSDMMILAMSFPNIIGLYIMSGEVKKDLDDYLRKLKAGELFQKQRSPKTT